MNVDTDFVVMGNEPEVPALAETTTRLDHVQKRERPAGLEAYERPRRQGQGSDVPIMNQNRFLYYVGYYDQAQR